MKKSIKIGFIIFFMSVISFIGISNAKALYINNFGIEADLPDFTSNTNYSILYSNNSSRPGFWIFESATITASVVSNHISTSNPFGITDIWAYFGNSSTKGRLYKLQNNQWVYDSQQYGIRISSGPNNPAFIVYTSADIRNRYNSSILYYSAGYQIPSELDFITAVEQGEVLLANSDAINNLVSYYLEYDDADENVNDYYKFYYSITTGGGSRESVRFYMKYNENGISYNNHIYHYFYNLPLSYNAQITYNIYDNDDELVKSDNVTAYLSSLTSLNSYDMYDFTNYNIANMSYVNNDMFGVSEQANSLGYITVNVVNYNTGVKTDFFNSTYYISSHTDSAKITWYEFDFNNEPLYLEIINNMSNNIEIPRMLNTWEFFLYFPSDAYVHLSTYPITLDEQTEETNQQAYKDENGDINYVNNNIIYSLNNSTEFFANLSRYFNDIDNFNSGLTGIIVSPLNLIQNLLTPTCSDLSIPLPYINSTLTLPCMETIYSQYFGSFFTLYQNVSFGIIAYWVSVKILRMVKDFRSPDHDEIEVLDL